MSKPTLPSGFMATLDDSQAKALEELKQRVLQSEFQTDYQQDPGKECFLLQFLRATMKDKTGARIFNVDAAMERLVATFKWRREFNVNELIESVEKDGPRPANYDVFSQHYPRLDLINKETGTFVRFARFGRFINYLKPDAMSWYDWARCFAYDGLWIQRQLRLLSAQHGREISSYVCVIDDHGASLLEVTRKVKFLQAMAAVAGDHFPEMLAQTLIIRCPKVFPAIYALVKPFIDKDTASKFVLSSSIPLEALQNLLPMSEIPKEYGGNGEKSLGYPLGDTSNPELAAN